MPAIMTNGVPMRFWNHREDREETAYLSTRRAGQDGLALRHHRGVYNEAESRLQRLGRDMRLVSLTVRDDMPLDELRAAAARQDDLSAELRVAEAALIEAADTLVRVALTDCHGEDEAARIMDCLCDRQVLQAVRMLEIGEEPKDFFDGRGTRPSAPGTGRVAATSGASSPRPATAPATSATPIS